MAFDEAFMDNRSEGNTVLEGEKESLNSSFLFLGLILFVGFLGVRLYQLQVFQGDEFRSLAEGNKLKVEYVLAPRGLIVDKYNKVIASNTPSFELVAASLRLKDDSLVDAKLAIITQSVSLDAQELKKLIADSQASGSDYFTLAVNLTKEQALFLISKQNELSGFSVQNNPIRDYKDPLVFAHLVGYTGKITKEELSDNQSKNYLFNDVIGKTNLEVQYESYLRGIAGRKQIEVDATGNFRKNLPEVPPLPGHNLKLNIDYDLQKTIYESMESVMKRTGSRKAVAVATDPATGKVLALVNFPSYDNNWFARGISQSEYSSLIQNSDHPLLNRAVAGTYPPGSMVKPMLAIGALTEGIVKPETKILDDGVIRIGSFTFYCYNRAGLGMMDLYSAIARSSDIYFYTIGGGSPTSAVKGMGPDKLAFWYRNFYLGQKLGIDLPGEKEGLVPDPDWKLKNRNEQWYLGNTYHFAIGQGDLLVTPLQANSWTATIANGGKIMRPYILDEVASINGEKLQTSSPQVLKENFLDQQWVDVVRTAMRQTVTEGSARSLASLNLPIAGKTGTAQFDGSNLSRTHAWFTSFAPFDNPQIALTVLVESGGEGSSVAVPISKEVYKWWESNRWNR